MNILTFTPTGEVVGLYTEVIPLTELGSLHIERWTVLEFNNSTEEWEVKRLTRDGLPDQTVLFSHPSRQACLHWERWLFDGGHVDDDLTYRPSDRRKANHHLETPNPQETHETYA